MYSSRTLLTRKDLEIQDKQKEYLKERVLNKVLEDILIKIKFMNRTNNKDGILEVPKTKLGVPSYNYSECLYYVITKLREMDFFVRFINPNKIYVSWYSPEDLMKVQERQIFLKNEVSSVSNQYQLMNFNNK